MITVERVGRECDQIISNLYEHYVHDMSEWLDLQVNANGLFEYPTAPLWNDDIAVYLAKSEKALVGFAVTQSAEKWLGKPGARDVKDFFVLRAHRHRGTAMTIAEHIWNESHGEWLVRVLLANKPAVPFWRRAAQSQSKNRCTERSVVENGREWIYLSFDNTL